jgi:hypothetical protein
MKDYFLVDGHLVTDAPMAKRARELSGSLFTDKIHVREDARFVNATYKYYCTVY